MTNKDSCPDCGAGIGSPHVDDCDVERITGGCEDHEPMESEWTGEWPFGDEAESSIEESEQAEEPGFIILDQTGQETRKSVPVELTPLVEPPRRYPDDICSANARMDWTTHVAEPIYKDGVATGEWRVARRTKRWDIPGKDVPWEAVFSNQEAAMDWARAIRESERA